MPKPNPKQLSLTVQYVCNNSSLPLRPKLRKWVGAALEDDVVSATLTLRFVDAEEGRELNRGYRGKNNATNVLSFAYDPPPRLVGDLVLCVPVVLEEAVEQGKPAGDHFAHLVVHGMLHLQGYDHQSDAEAKLMESKEGEILARLGVGNPY